MGNYEVATITKQRICHPSGECCDFFYLRLLMENKYQKLIRSLLCRPSEWTRDQKTKRCVLTCWFCIHGDPVSLLTECKWIWKMTLDSYFHISRVRYACEVKKRSKVHIRTSDAKCMLSARVENSISECAVIQQTLKPTSPSRLLRPKIIISSHISVHKCFMWRDHCLL